MTRKGLALASAITALSCAATQPTMADESLKAEIEALKSQVNALADALDSQATGDRGVSIGGYGELHFNLNQGADNEVDFHRFVLFFNKEFSDRTRLFTELELEHSLAGDGKPGEVELEQAYIQHDVNDTLQVNAGLFLMPVGLLNETHEPDTFYGVERNAVEKNIIPTTWWEAGVGITAKLADGLTLDAAVHSGLNMFTTVDATDDDGNVVLDADGNAEQEASIKAIRSGRQKVAEAVGNKLAYTARLKYTAVPGLQLGLAVSKQDDVLQGQHSEEIDGLLIETHAVYQTGGFGLRALYAQWKFDDAANDLAGKGVAEQSGYYIEPSYRMGDFGVFARMSAYDKSEDDSTDSEVTQQDVGVNYYLADTVVFKADYFRTEAGEDDTLSTGYNFGVGYSF